MAASTVARVRPTEVCELEPPLSAGESKPGTPGVVLVSVPPASSVSRVSETPYTRASLIRSAASRRRRNAVQPSTSTAASASRPAQRQSPVTSFRPKKEYTWWFERSIAARSVPPWSEAPRSRALSITKVEPEPKPSSSRPRLGRKASEANVAEPSPWAATTRKAASEASPSTAVSARPAVSPATAQPRTPALRQAAQRSASVPYTARAGRPASRTVQARACGQPASAPMSKPEKKPPEKSEVSWVSCGGCHRPPQSRPSSSVTTVATSAVRTASPKACCLVTCPPVRACQVRSPRRRPSQSASSQSTRTVIGSTRSR